MRIKKHPAWNEINWPWLAVVVVIAVFVGAEIGAIIGTVWFIATHI